MKDRLWFFLAGRKENRNTQDTLRVLGSAVPEQAATTSAWRSKLTGTVAPNHTLQGVYTVNRTSDASPSFDFSIAPSTFDVAGVPAEPASSLNYNGVLRVQPLPGGAVLAAEARLPRRRRHRHQPRHRLAVLHLRQLSGGGARPALQRALLRLRHRPRGPRQPPVHRPACRISCPRRSLGRHDLKGGFEYYRSTLKGGNSQSPTSFVYYADYKTDAAGNPVLDANGNLTPVFEPGGGLILNWLAERGAVLNVNTTTLYLNDRWTAEQPLGLQPRPALRAGAQRHDLAEHLRHRHHDPRAAAGRGLRSHGQRPLQAPGHVFALRRPRTTRASSATTRAPAIRASSTASTSARPGEGLNFAPGFDPANYRC